MLKQRTKLKIILTLFIAFLLTDILSKNIFLADTPKINKAFLANLKNSPGNFVAFLTNSRTNQNADFKKFENSPISALKPVAKGIYAGENSNGRIVYIRVAKDIEFEEREINYEGRKIKVRFPKGMLE